MCCVYSVHFDAVDTLTSNFPQVLKIRSLIVSACHPIMIFVPHFWNESTRCTKKFTLHETRQVGSFSGQSPSLWFSSWCPSIVRSPRTYINSVPKLSSISAIGGGRKQRRRREVPHATKRLAQIEMERFFFFLFFFCPYQSFERRSTRTRTTGWSLKDWMI